MRTINHKVTLEQAEAVSTSLRGLLRQLMAGVDDPAVELPLAQLRVCSVLCGGPLPMSALSRELGVSFSAMTQTADRLERARLVRRVPKGSDRRIRCLELTERGAKIMRRHDAARLERIQTVLEHLPSKARQEVLATLQTLIRACVAALLNYGRIVGNVALQDAKFRELVLAYQNTVLTADQEVEDGLTTFLRSQERTDLLAESVMTLRDAVLYVSLRKEKGQIDVNRYSVVAQNLVQQENSWAQSEGLIAQGLITVYRALGGGWEIRLGGNEAPPPMPEPPPPAANPPEQIPAPPSDVPPAVPAM